MQVLHEAGSRPELPHGSVVTVGNYDGIHRGQRSVLERVVAAARADALPAVVVTFEPHPRTVLQPERAPAALTTWPQRQRLLEAAGIDLVLRLKFDRAFAATPAETFVREFLCARLGVRRLFVGSDFSFGRGRSGNLSLLLALGKELGFEATGVEKMLWRDAPISSTRIREALERGEVEAAGSMLGRPYALEGRIVGGARRGRELGWPTANLDTDNPILPRDGVYAASLRIAGESGRPGVANVGVRPTLGNAGDRLAEIHLLDFEGDLYGSAVELLFHRRLRDERRFPSLEALRERIGQDVAAAREYFEEYAC